MASRFFDAWFRFAAEHTKAYILLCIAGGGFIRLWWAHWDLGLWLNPGFPWFIR